MCWFGADLQFVLDHKGQVEQIARRDAVRYWGQILAQPVLAPKHRYRVATQGSGWFPDPVVPTDPVDQHGGPCKWFLPIATGQDGAYQGHDACPCADNACACRATLARIFPGVV